MASSKDVPVARPASGSFSRLSSSMRSHSGSVSLSATNSAHRINRRKSVNASASSTSTAALAAALREHGETSAMPLANGHRRSGSSKKTESQSMSARPSMHSYFNAQSGPYSGEDHEVVEDNSQDDEASSKMFNKQRNRRASEGAHLIKGDGKKSGGDLRCETCGKGYKHSSCLTKHLWEHDPAWAITSKLLISKHQQVQLLEAASVLCNMTTENIPTVIDLDPAMLDQSEASSASPDYSGSSEMQDELSSVETTPPPMGESVYAPFEHKRNSSSSNGFSRSYRSVPSSSFAESIVSPALLPQRLSGADLRPSTSGTDDGNLAAATAGLSFNGTPGMRPTLGSDIPPVPPLPQQYQSYNSKSSSSTLTNVYNPLALQPPSLTHQLSDERNYKDDSSGFRKDTTMSGITSHLEEEGMFKMEE